MRGLLIAFHELASVNGSLPEELARIKAVTINALNLLFLVGGTKENFAAENYGRTMAAPGYGRLPNHLLGRTPTERQILTGRRHARMAWPTPPRPILTVDEISQSKNAKEKKN